MRARHWVAAGAFAVILSLAARAARAQDAEGEPPVTWDDLYGAVAPYGTWFQHPTLGQVWQPSPDVVGSDFVPYGTAGQWLWTDAGWYWESDYEWGWAPFHYGRWSQDPDYGWLWTPDLEWGPGWVTWRTNGQDSMGQYSMGQDGLSQGFVSWAPRPPPLIGYFVVGWIVVPWGDFRAPNPWRHNLNQGAGPPPERGRPNPPPRPATPTAPPRTSPAWHGHPPAPHRTATAPVGMMGVPAGAAQAPRPGRTSRTPGPGAGVGAGAGVSVGVVGGPPLGTPVRLGGGAASVGGGGRGPARAPAAAPASGAARPPAPVATPPAAATSPEGGRAKKR